jgi:hypothetical protein
VKRRVVLTISHAISLIDVEAVVPVFQGVVKSSAADSFDGCGDHVVGSCGAAEVQEDEGVDAVGKSDSGEVGVVEELAGGSLVTFG